MAVHPLSTASWMETTDTMHAACQTATGDNPFPSRLESFHQCTKVADCSNLLADDPEHSLPALTLHQDPQTRSVPAGSTVPSHRHGSETKLLPAKLPPETTLMFYQLTASLPSPTVDFGSHWSDGP